MSLRVSSDYLVSQVEDVRVELLLVVPSDVCYRYTTSSWLGRLDSNQQLPSKAALPRDMYQTVATLSVSLE